MLTGDKNKDIQYVDGCLLHWNVLDNSVCFTNRIYILPDTFVFQMNKYNLWNC